MFTQANAAEVLFESVKSKVERVNITKVKQIFCLKHTDYRIELERLGNELRIGNVDWQFWSRRLTTLMQTLGCDECIYFLAQKFKGTG